MAKLRQGARDGRLHLHGKGAKRGAVLKLLGPGERLVEWRKVRPW